MQLELGMWGEVRVQGLHGAFKLFVYQGFCGIKTVGLKMDIKRELN